MTYRIRFSGHGSWAMNTDGTYQEETSDDLQYLIAKGNEWSSRANSIGGDYWILDEEGNTIKGGI